MEFLNKLLKLNKNFDPIWQLSGAQDLKSITSRPTTNPFQVIRKHFNIKDPQVKLTTFLVERPNFSKNDLKLLASHPSS